MKYQMPVHKVRVFSEDYASFKKDCPYYEDQEIETVDARGGKTGVDVNNKKSLKNLDEYEDNIRWRFGLEESEADEKE